MSYNFLLEVPDRALAPLTSLQYLELFGNIFLTFTFGDGFRNLTKLSILSINSVRYPDERRVHLNSALQNLAQAPLTKLRIFFTYNFSITIGNELFAPLSNLTWIATGFQWQDAVPSVKSSLRYYHMFLAPNDLKINRSTLHFLSNCYNSLEILDISYSEVIGIYGPAFEMFPNLRILNVSRVVYSMQYISNEALYGLQNLEELYLANNQINKLPVKAFKAFQGGKLKLLDLSYNSLTVFTRDDAFISVSNLTHLNLSNNPIWSIGKWIHVLTDLQELKLSSVTSPYTMELYLWTKPLPNLRYLDFTSPDLTKEFFYAGTFRMSEVVPNIQMLSFAFAYIYSMEFINDLKYLKYLDVSGSFSIFKDFEKEWGANVSFPQLQVLKLRSNKMMSIDEMDFDASTPNLIDLDLCDNDIQTFPESALDILRNLRYLKLTGNRILSLSGLLDLQSIRYLDVSRNMISEIPLTLLNKINSSLEILDASGNPFSCTCAIEPFQKWFRSNVDVVLVPGSQYKCKTPDHLQGESIMEVNLDCKSHAVLYAIIGILGGLLSTIMVFLVVKYRWHIKYRLFLLFTLKRKYQPLQIEEEGEDVNLNRVQYDAFISYAHDNDRDLSWVLNDLRVNIEEDPEPFQLCIGHARDFIPGAPLLEAITEAIHNSRKTIIVLSPSYLDSEWCYFETQHAWLRLLNEGKDVIILVLLEPIPDAKMTMWLRQFLCKKGYLRWPPDRAGQKLFFRYLRELMKSPTAVNRRYDV